MKNRSRYMNVNVGPGTVTIGASDNVVNERVPNFGIEYIQLQKRERVLSLEEMEERLVLLKQEEIGLHQRIASLSKLPETLLTVSDDEWCSVFSAVVRSSKKDLLNCRLVCRKWNDVIIRYQKILCEPSGKYMETLKTLAVEDMFPLHVRMSTNQMFIFFHLISSAEWYAHDLVTECLKKVEFKFTGPRTKNGVYVAIADIGIQKDIKNPHFGPKAAQPFQIEIACNFNFNFKELQVGFGQLELSMLQWFSFSYNFPNLRAFVLFPTTTQNAK